MGQWRSAWQSPLRERRTVPLTGSGSENVCSCHPAEPPCEAGSDGIPRHLPFTLCCPPRWARPPTASEQTQGNVTMQRRVGPCQASQEQWPSSGWSAQRPFCVRAPPPHLPQDLQVPGPRLCLLWRGGAALLAGGVQLHQHDPALCGGVPAPGGRHAALYRRHRLCRPAGQLRPVSSDARLCW